MQVILLKDVKKMGHRYDTKSVADGYALNYLIPNGLAEIATERNAKKFGELRAYAEKARKEQEAAIAAHLKKLEEKPIELEGKANPKGHLFAGIHKAELAEQLSKAVGTAISPDFIELEKPIKEVGEHMVMIKVGDKSAKIKVLVKAIE